MAERNRTELKTFREDRIKEGPDGSINPAIDNQVREAEAESAVNIVENGDLLNLQDYKSNRSKPYKIGEGFFKDGQLRRATFGQSGQYNSGYSQAITLPTITSVVPAYSETEELSAGQVRSFNGMLALKVGATVTGADPYDPYEFTLFNPLLPYYGILYVQNQVYVTNMVVRRAVSGKSKLFRKVKPSGGSPEYIYSTNFATELANGEWEEEIQQIQLDEVEVNGGSAIIVNDTSYHNKHYIINAGVSVDLKTVTKGVVVYFYLAAEGGGEINFTADTTLKSSSSQVTTPYIEVKAISLGGGSWLVTNTNTGG